MTILDLTLALSYLYSFLYFLGGSPRSYNTSPTLINDIASAGCKKLSSAYI